MLFKYCALTDTGRVRDNNEDSVVFDEASNVAVLADGMGGYNAGEVASGMATESILRDMQDWLGSAGADVAPHEIWQAMESTVNRTNLAIFNAAHANPDYAGMGTTMVMGVFRPGSVSIGHVGDSRCYCLRAGDLRQITRDHSLLQEQIDAGLVTPEQAVHSNIRNLVTRAVGVDVVTLLEVKEHTVAEGDLYLMCSDGLSDMVGAHVIAKIVASNSGLQEKARRLIDAANENGGRDNISVLLVEAFAGQDKHPSMVRAQGG